MSATDRATETAEILETLKPIEEREIRAAIPLRHLVLCIECDTAYSAHGAGCPACGSRSRFTVTRVIQPMGDGDEVAA